MEKIYNKLVRDKIPEIIENDGEIVFMHVLSDAEYRLELYKKLNEECMEVASSKTSKEILEELADVLEVLRSIAELEGSQFGDIIQIADKKKEKRGGFQKRIFLEKTIVKK